jgi:alpha-L-fucosidase
MNVSKIFRLAVFAIACLAAVQPAAAEESAADKDKRMAWFRDARFGMFIHWGLYSQAAGEWNGKQSPRAAEWLQFDLGIPTSQYTNLVSQFNPVKFNARDWVHAAKNAGMKYICITTKHHDGFAIYPSDLTDWCIKSTAFQRDPLKELAEACQAEGVRLCFYHSIMDWHHPDYVPRKPWTEFGNPQPDFDRYVGFMKGQLKELLTRYGPIGILWFDGEWESTWNYERGLDLYNYVRGLQPNIIVNNRVGNARAGMSGMDKGGKRVGDYGTPEQEIPPTGFGPGVDWESCMTMNDTWGFNKGDHHWKSSQTLIRNLIDCASKGGNYLLNVGPTGEGVIPEESLQRLADVGRWMKANSDAIYGTQASPFEKLDWGRCTQKKLAHGDTRLYLHVFDWPKNGQLLLPGLANKPLKASLLDGGKMLEVSAEDGVVTINVPDAAPDKNATVIALDLKGEPRIVKLDPYADETPEQRDARMKWFREARFGMFIHWGVYSVPAGTYHGRKIDGIGEWIMNTAKIPMAEYRDYAKQFNPVKFNADEWVRLAKEAGMKYIVITSKHHDGFAMFDSKASDWNIVKATPYGRDALKDLAAACKKHGIKLGFYYSQAQDWNNGGAGYGGNWDKAQDHDMTDYIRRIAAPQVREILTHYGPIAVLWWDTPVDMTRERASLLLPLLKLQPGIIYNDRLGGGFGGDTSTPEQYIPPTGLGKDWETCMTMNDTWGFKSYDQNWKSAETLVRNLVDIASKGGNYLLNVGPTPEGLIPGPSVERLKAVGQWMKVNGEAIYGTTASPLPLSWGRCTKKASAKGTTLYLHVFDWPADGKLLVPALENKVVSAYLLADPKRALPTESSMAGVTISVPAKAPDAISSTVVLKVAGDVQKILPTIAQSADGSVALPAKDAQLHGSTFRYEVGGPLDNIGFWTEPADWLDWQCAIAKPGKFEITAEISAPASSPFELNVGGRKVRCHGPATGDYFTFKPVKLGEVEVSSPGRISVAVRPIKDGWQPMNLKSIRLTPVGP